MKQSELMSPSQAEMLNLFTSTDGISDSHRLLAGAIFCLWTDCLNELIDDAETEGLEQFANNVRYRAREFGFEVDDRHRVTPAITREEEPKIGLEKDVADILDYVNQGAVSLETYTELVTQLMFKHGHVPTARSHDAADALITRVTKNSIEAHWENHNASSN